MLPVVRIVGAGVRGPKGVTLEAIVHLRLAKKVLFFPSAGITSEWLLQSLGVLRVEDLSATYQDGGVDVENYARIVSRVTTAAHRLRDVAYLCSGNPWLGSTVVGRLNQIAVAGQIRLRRCDGVSSLDAMMADLGRDPLICGTIVVDANRLLLHRPRLDPTFDTYVYDVCSTGTNRTFQREPSRENAISRLRDYLVDFYPAEHKAFLVATGQTLRDGWVEVATIGSLQTFLPKLTFGSTLWIPGSSSVLGYD
jgi:hypothetical protein